MASGIHNVPNQPRLDIPELQQIRRLGRQVRNLLVLDLLLLQQLSRIPLGLLDRPNLLLKDVELSSGRLLLVLDCASVGKQNKTQCRPLVWHGNNEKQY